MGTRTALESERAAVCRTCFGAKIRDLMVGKKELVIQVTDIHDEPQQRSKKPIGGTYVCSCRRRAAFLIVTHVETQDGAPV